MGLCYFNGHFVWFIDLSYVYFFWLKNTDDQRFQGSLYPGLFFYIKNNTGIMLGAALGTTSDPFPALLF